MARMRIAPVTTSCQKLEIPAIESPFCSVPMNRTPTAVPATPPTPPEKSVARLTDHELGAAREMLDDGEALLREGAYDEWERVNRDFHSILIAPACESVLQSCQGIIDGCFRYRKVYVLAQPLAFVHGQTDHRLVLDACEARDPGKAAAALARHLARTALTLLAAADPGYDPVAVRTAMRMVAGRYGEDVVR